MSQLDDVKQKMQKSITNLENGLATIRTSGANPALLADVQIDYYGMETPINQMCSISVVEGKQLVVKPYDASILKSVEKAIFQANLGLTPQNEGQQLRINVPPLTEERRKEYTAKVKTMAEEAKVAVRNIRRDYNDQIKKDKTIPEDTQKDLLDQIQKATDEFTKKVDEVAAKKNKEIMTI